jgi:hypothetical protein
MTVAAIPTTVVEEEEVLVAAEAEAVVAEVEEVGAVATVITIKALAATTAEGILRNKRNSNILNPLLHNNKANLPLKPFSLQYRQREVRLTRARVILLSKVERSSDCAICRIIVMKLTL